MSEQKTHQRNFGCLLKAEGGAVRGEEREDQNKAARGTREYTHPAPRWLVDFRPPDLVS